MRRDFMKLVLWPLVLAALMTASCGTEGIKDSAHPVADEFNRLIHNQIGVDYEPLAGPAEAVSVADAIVRGDVVRVSDGLTISLPTKALVGERSENLDSDQNSNEVLFSYVTVELRVSDVIVGDGIEAGDVLHIQLDRSPITSVDELSEVAPLGPAVFILEDASGWVPLPNVDFERPATMPTDATIYIPYSDGTWFPTSGGIGGPFANGENLSASWGAPGSLDALSQILGEAARGPIP